MGQGITSFVFHALDPMRKRSGRPGRQTLVERKGIMTMAARKYALEDGYRWEQVANNKWVTYLHRKRTTPGGEIAQIIPIFAEIPLSGMEVELLADKWMEENSP